MFFWLMAIPFFVIIAMFTLFKLPSNDLKKPEEIQDTAMAFRMALQHDAAAKLMEAYRADSESTLFDLGSYNMEGEGWKAMLEGSKYLPANFITDTDNIVTYIRCLNGLREVVNCRKATGIYMITASAVPSADAQTARWFETVGAEDLAEQLGKYAGSFPIRQNGYSLPKKPRKQEGETDEAYAVRLNAYKAEKKDYAKLKRRYYDFGDKLPRPDTTVGQVRAYPFDEEEEANERVIVRRIRSAEGNTVNYETVKVPVDIPDADGQTFDFNGEAVIFTESSSCKEGPCACTKGTDCGEGVYCLSGTCSADCGLYGFDPNRTCYTTCTSDSQCPEGYFCDSGVCTTTKTCSTNDDCPSAKPYCNYNVCSAYPPYTVGQVVASATNSTKNHSHAISQAVDPRRCDQYSTNPIIILSTVTVPAGKYKIVLKGEAGYYDSSYSGHATAWGGIITAEKVVQDGTTFTIKSISGWYGGGPSNYGYWFWTGAGTGLWENGNVALAAGRQ